MQPCNQATIKIHHQVYRNLRSDPSHVKQYSKMDIAALLHGIGTVFISAHSSPDLSHCEITDSV